jgi:glutaredoxin
MKLFKQECPLVVLYAAGGLYIAMLIYTLITREYLSAAVVLVLTPALWWGVRRYIAVLSRWFGYGRIDDQLPTAVRPSLTQVTLYTAAGCLFCPIVKQRLAALQPQMHFELEVVDVTLRPDILLAKGYASVPVIEAGQRRLVGNATSADLAELIGAATNAAARVPEAA